jgi:hypothetical protein
MLMGIVVIAIRIGDASPPRRGELRKPSVVNNSGGLPNSEQNDDPDSYRDDATDDDSSNAAG